MARNLLASVQFRSTLMVAGSGEVTMTAQASATTFYRGTAVVDTQGFDEFTGFANPGGTSQIKLAMASATGDTFDDIAGSNVTGSAAHQLLAVSVTRPQKRYVKALVATTVGAVSGKIWYALSQPRDLAVTNVLAGASGMAASEIKLSAATGTA